MSRGSLARYIKIALALVLFSPAVHGDSLYDGGRDVSVLLFSTHRLSAVTLTPLSPSAWTASCSACLHKPLRAPLDLRESGELFAGGQIRVTDVSSHEQRAAEGLWRLRSSPDGVDVVLTLPSERYVAAVVNAETASDEPTESLQALAIVARTYALNGRHYMPAPGHLSAELCDSTECQALRLGSISPAIENAVRTTAGETLWFANKHAEVFFSQHCGGTTEDAAAVWPRLRGLTYLSSHADPYCLRRSTAAWHTEVTLHEFVSIAQTQGWRLPQPVVALRVVERSRSHRALLVSFSDGVHSTTISAGAMRLAIDRALGWNRIRSDQYELALRDGIIIFDGHGYGHGVGLCQTGAAEMATEHKSTRQILNFYFPGVAIRIGPDDEGWQTVRTPSLIVRGTVAISSAQETEFENTWQEARRRFPTARAFSPEITLAPSTELFRQLTSQPGWTLASTSGRQMVLQPEPVLLRSGISRQKLLLHEMLHLLVESEAGDHAPLWLREGLVEELSGGDGNPAPILRTETIDDVLLRPTSRSASEQAHRAAAAKVHQLVSRYGISTVRGWLVSGPPSGIS